MNQAIPTLLGGWQSYYVIIGSSAGALTGLQFVVMALIAESPAATKDPEQGVAAFGSPIVMHFCAALLLSAILSAPWPANTGVTIALDACGAAGMAYVLIVSRRARRQSSYEMTSEDWRWHVVIPFLAYATFFVAGLMLPSHPANALFVAAVAPAALLYTGIRNAWDSVTYLVINLKTRDGTAAGNSTGD
jgi:cobalamin synthase